MKTTIADARPLLINFIKANIPAKLTSSPGLGKSDLVKAVAKQLNLQLIDIRLSTCDPSDLVGLPSIKDGRSVWSPNQAFPISTDKIPEGKDGWLLFLDEIADAPRSVQSAAYRLILDREVGQYKLHENVRVVCAGNSVTDNAGVVEEMSTALKSRMAHINLVLDANAWLEWAYTANIHPSVTAWIKFKQNELYNFKPDSADDTFPCPRTWSMVSNVVDTIGLDSPYLDDMVAATISDGAAIQYIEYTKVFNHLPTFEEMIKNPTGFAVPQEPGARYALSSVLASRMLPENADKAWQAVERLPTEFVYATFLQAILRTPMLITVPRVSDWAKKFAPQLMKKD